jgi:hypothetical protein
MHSPRLCTARYWIVTDELAKASLRHPTMTQQHSLSNLNALFLLNASKE